MEPVSRRGFIVRTSVAAAAAGAAIALPETAAGASEREARLPKDAELDETVVAHLKDLHNGKIAVFAGDREIVITDKRLAALLFKATR